MTWWQVLVCPTEVNLFLLESPWNELQGRMGWLTCLGAGASKLSKTGTKQVARKRRAHRNFPMITLGSCGNNGWSIGNTDLGSRSLAVSSDLHHHFHVGLSQATQFLWASISLFVKLELLLALPLERETWPSRSTFECVVNSSAHTNLITASIYQACYVQDIVLRTLSASPCFIFMRTL